MESKTNQQPIPAPAATVILVRQYEDALQVYLLKYSSLDDLQMETENRQWGEARLPRLIPGDRGAVILEPWDPQYSQQKIQIDTENLHDAVLPVGESFWLLFTVDPIPIAY